MSARIVEYVYFDIEDSEELPADMRQSRVAIFDDGYAQFDPDDPFDPTDWSAAELRIIADHIEAARRW